METNLQLLSLRKVSSDELERARRLSHLLPAEKAVLLGAVITDISDSGYPTVLLNKDSQQVRQDVSRILKKSSFFITFYTETPEKFQVYLGEVYPQLADEFKASSEWLEEVETKNYARNNTGDGENRGVLPEGMVEDQTDASGRMDLTDETEFRQNLKKKISELSTYHLARLVLWMFIASGGSDLYLEPQGETGRIRVNIDDTLSELNGSWNRIPNIRLEDLSRALISMARDNSNRMRFESIDSDIRVKARVGGQVKNFEFRFHSHPTIHGTSIVIRSQSRLIKDFEKTGLENFQIDLINHASRERQGMILITGATGSGKTGTLECIYEGFKREGTKKVIEIVESVEVVSPDRDQIVISGNFTWDDAFAACMRSKPHVIGVGEMRRTVETVKAVEGAMSGHLVLATYHAGNIVKTLQRLRQMDVDVLNLAPSLNLILSQILVNKLCPECRLKDEARSKEFGRTVYRAGAGCQNCEGKKYRGKTALGECLLFNEEVEGMLIERMQEKDILTEMRQQGLFTPFAVTGRMKVLNGETSFDEVSRMLGKVSEQFYGDDEWRSEISRLNNKFHSTSGGSGHSATHIEYPRGIDSSTAERIRKCKNLSENGIAGEKTNAKGTLDMLIRKYALSKEELEFIYQGEVINSASETVRL